MTETVDKLIRRIKRNKTTRGFNRVISETMLKVATGEVTPKEAAAVVKAGRERLRKGPR